MCLNIDIRSRGFTKGNHYIEVSGKVPDIEMRVGIEDAEAGR